MKIHILLPFKDKFDKNLSGSVSITLQNTILFSSFKQIMHVYGDEIYNPIYPEIFFGVKRSKNPFKRPTVKS